jgi:hypothetical protein
MDPYCFGRRDGKGKAADPLRFSAALQKLAHNANSGRGLAVAFSPTVTTGLNRDYPRIQRLAFISNRGNESLGTISTGILSARLR